jgi:hypothetical protein
VSQGDRRLQIVFARAAAYLRLSGQYPDIDADLIGDLVSASCHVMWVPFSVPSQEAIDAYVDRVVGLLRAARTDPGALSDEDVAGSARLSPRDVDFRLLTMRQVHLGEGPWSDAAVDRTGRFVAAQRLDLDQELLRELCLAAYLRHRREGLTPTRDSVLALVNRIAPALVTSQAGGTRIPPTGLTLKARKTPPPGASRNRRRSSEVPAGPRRARGLANPEAAFQRALLDVANLGEGRLSKTAVAAHMGINRKTLNRYIADRLIRPPPWESLAVDLSRTSRTQ